jgi:hypothetical protein
VIAPEGFDFGTLRVLFRCPTSFTLWGIPYEMRSGQQPGDLYRAAWPGGRGSSLPRKVERAAPADWVYLGSPGWFQGSEAYQARVREFLATLETVPGHPWEWCAVERKEKVEGDGER